MHPLFERGKPEQLSQVRRGFFPEVGSCSSHAFLLVNIAVVVVVLVNIVVLVVVVAAVVLT